jgi:hypothetical protein
MRAIATIGSILVAALLAEGCTGSGPTPAPTKDPRSPYATTRAEYFLAVKACLQDRGFAVEIDVDQGAIITNESTDERAREAAAATKECQKAIDPKRLEPPPKPDVDELRAWYAYVVAQVQCYRAAGYAVPDPPPEQVFIDSGGLWDPAGKLLETTGQAIPPDPVHRCQAVPERPSFFDW